MSVRNAAALRRFGQLGPRPDAELAVRTTKDPFHCLDTEKHPIGDFTVAQSLHGEIGDLSLRVGEVIGSPGPESDPA